MLVLIKAAEAQKAEVAASAKQVVPQKFRRKPLDPDERYAQERARVEAVQAQRAAQVCCPPSYLKNIHTYIHIHPSRLSFLWGGACRAAGHKSNDDLSDIAAWKSVCASPTVVLLLCNLSLECEIVDVV